MCEKTTDKIITIHPDSDLFKYGVTSSFSYQLIRHLCTFNDVITQFVLAEIKLLLFDHRR